MLDLLKLSFVINHSGLLEGQVQVSLLKLNLHHQHVFLEFAKGSPQYMEVITIQSDGRAPAR